MRIQKFLLLISLTLLPAVALATTHYSGTVIAVTEGESIQVLDTAKQTRKIRLYGIDCPEKGQAFAEQSREFTKRKVLNQPVRVMVQSHDRQGREVAILFGQGFCLNEELLKAGLAWVYLRGYKEQNKRRWPALQAAAKAAQLGLWADTDPTPPWEFRKNR